ncbi:MAG: tripartite tricarboxylate transporter substrate-binding protein [Planctomycetota bacterium]
MRLIALGLVLLLAKPSLSQEDQSAGDFPRKPIKVIVPFGAGGGTDTFTRILQKVIEKYDLLPQPLVIINVPGAAGSIGSRRVKNARPDGYTILQIHEGMLTNKHSGNSNFGPESFQPIAGTGEMAHLIAVPDDSPYQDLASLLQAAEDKPDSIVYAVGIGAPSHFSGLMLEAAKSPECKFRFVQSGGGADRFTSLLGGHSEVSTFSVGEFVEFQKSGLRGIGILTQQRNPQLPDLPTAKEQGFDVISSNMHFWWAPKGTDPQRTERIAQALQEAMKIDEVRKQLASIATSDQVILGKALVTNLEEREQRIASVSKRESPNLPDFGVAVLAFTLIGGVIAFLPTSSRDAADASDSTGEKHISDSATAWILLAATLTYVACLQLALLDYRIATAGFILASGLTCSTNRKHWLPVVALAFALSFGLHYLFSQILIIDLP